MCGVRIAILTCDQLDHAQDSWSKDDLDKVEYVKVTREA